MSMLIYAVCWLAYLASATVLYRVFIVGHLAVWFPNSERQARLFFLVTLFSPALLVENGNLSVVPALILPWFLFGGLALVLDAAGRRREPS